LKKLSEHPPQGRPDNRQGLQPLLGVRAWTSPAGTAENGHSSF
jgi:hypothetical protein